MKKFKVSKDDTYKVEDPYTGDVHSLRYPTCGDLDDLQQDQNKHGTESLLPMINFFVHLGMPEESVRSFKAEWLVDMMTDMSSKKK